MKRERSYDIVGKGVGSSESASSMMDDFSHHENGEQKRVLDLYKKYVGEYRGAVKERGGQEGNRFFPTQEQLNGRYKRIKKIGEGTFGEVFIVFDTVANTYLTMKRMRRFLHSSSRGKNVGLHSTTHREIQLLTTLRHPNITHIVDSFILEDGTVIVFFPIVAHDLSALQRTKRDAFGVRQSGLLPLPVVKCIFRQLLEAVAHIHAHKVIHRDIKPSNIMVDHNGIVSLIDFGWARYQRIKGQMTGNPCNIVYRAPEMIANPYFASHYDFSVDVWCCGCVLFELLTGSRFITASNEMDTLRCIQDWLGAPPAKSAIYRSKSVLFGFDNKKTNQFSQRCNMYRLEEGETTVLQMMLQWEPSHRPFARQILSHSWFDAAPACCLPSEIPLPECNSYRWLQKR